MCSCACECDDCCDVQAVESLESGLVVHNQPQMVHKQLPAPKQQALKKSLQVFRHSLYSHLSCPSLFGIELATGITDALITDIAQNTYKYTSVDYILSLGLTASHAEKIVEIIAEIGILIYEKFMMVVEYSLIVHNNYNYMCSEFMQCIHMLLSMNELKMI